MTKIIHRYRDAFELNNLWLPIRGVLCVIDVCGSKPICCPFSRHGLYELKVINVLVQQLPDLDLIEPSEGPWGLLIVLAAKANQDYKHWSKYVLRPFVLYHKVNNIVWPFIYATQRCDYAVEDIGISKFFITFDLEMSYWQVYLYEDSWEITEFFTSEGKMQLKRIPMGFLNSMIIFYTIMDFIREDTNHKAADTGLTDDVSVTFCGTK